MFTLPPVLNLLWPRRVLSVSGRERVCPGGTRGLPGNVVVHVLCARPGQNGETYSDEGT